MSVTSLESFEHLMIYPLPHDDDELNDLAKSQVMYFKRKKHKKREIYKVKREMSQETAERWLKKHASKVRIDDLSKEETQAFFEWYTTTAVDLFEAGDGFVSGNRKLFQQLHTLGVFENKTQLIKFANMLNFKKKDQRQISLPEFTLALSGCGVREMSKFREYASSRQKNDIKIEKRRHVNKLPLNMMSKSSSMSSSYRRNSTANIKRITTRTPLTGGGVLYVCCPEVSSQFSSQHTRPTTAPVVTSLFTPDNAVEMAVPFSLPKTTCPPQKIGKLMRQKTSRLNLLDIEQGSILPKVCQSMLSESRKTSLLSNLGDIPESDVEFDQRPDTAPISAGEPFLGGKVRHLSAISGKTCPNIVVV